MNHPADIEDAPPPVRTARWPVESLLFAGLNLVGLSANSVVILCGFAIFFPGSGVGQTVSGLLGGIGLAPLVFCLSAALGVVCLRGTRVSRQAGALFTLHVYSALILAKAFGLFAWMATMGLLVLIVDAGLALSGARLDFAVIVPALCVPIVCWFGYRWAATEP